jgi:hypothetical protein
MYENGNTITCTQRALEIRPPVWKRTKGSKKPRQQTDRDVGSGVLEIGARSYIKEQMRNEDIRVGLETENIVEKLRLPVKKEHDICTKMSP